MNSSTYFALFALLLVGANAAAFPELVNVDVAHLNSMVHSIELQADASPACNAAMQAFATVAQSCTGVISTLGNIKNLTNAEVTAACSGSCITSYIDGLKAISTACGAASPIPNLDQTLSLITNGFRLICLKNNGQYCYANESQITAALNGHANDALYTPAELDQICSPCFVLYLKSLNEFLNTSTTDSVTNLICVKSGSDYCFPKFQNFSLFAQQHPNASLPVEAICDRCIQKVMSKSDEALGTSAYGSILNETASVCTRDGQNRLCSTLLGNAFEQVGQNCSPTDLQVGICPASCATAVSKTVTDGGCCAGNMVDEGAKQFGIPSAFLRQALSRACNVTIPASCDPKTATIDFSFKNLKYDYYLAHKMDVDQKVIKDVASQAGVPAWQVTVTKAASLAHPKYSLSSSGLSLFAAAGTVVTTKITSTGDVTTIQTDLQSAQTAGTLSFPSVGQLPVDARVDPTLSAGDIPASSGSNGGSASGASLIQPSALLAFLMVALALLA